MLLKRQTEQLKAYLDQLQIKFEENNPPKHINDQKFFLKMKEETSPIFELLHSWEKSALAYVKKLKGTLYPQQILSTKENVELIILHSYYIDIRKRQYMEINKSSHYVFDQILMELERMNERMKERLLSEARQARENAYVQYSGFAVGAALLTKSGEVFTGCNIENAAYPTTCCAERVAIFKAISEGERDFLAMAVVADSDRPVPPCGSCRQVMSEFFERDIQLYLGNLKGDIKTVTMNELLPFSFNRSDLLK